MVLPLFGGHTEKVIQGSPESLSKRRGESPVVNASVETEEQTVKVDGRLLVRLSPVRMAKSFTDSWGPGGTTPRPVSIAGIAKAMEGGIAKAMEGATRRKQPIIIQA